MIKIRGIELLINEEEASVQIWNDEDILVSKESQAAQLFDRIEKNKWWSAHKLNQKKFAIKYRSGGARLGMN